MKQSPPKAVLISEKNLLNRWRSLRFALTVLGLDELKVLSLFQAIESKVMAFKGSKPLHLV
jgi:hypothetical protein